jgi:hypothetical protein
MEDKAIRTVRRRASTADMLEPTALANTKQNSNWSNTDALVNSIRREVNYPASDSV